MLQTVMLVIDISGSSSPRTHRVPHAAAGADLRDDRQDQSWR